MEESGKSGIAFPYFEDEDPSQIVIKPLPKYAGHRSPVR